MQLRLLLFVLFLCPFILSGQLSIVDSTSTYTIDFDGSMSGVNEGVFQGNGFSTAPSYGQLSTLAWEIEGFTDGDKPFGMNISAGDYARGESAGGVTTGGLYSFDVGNGNKALGFQPTAGDFTPGTLTLKVENHSSSVVHSLAIDYIIYALNDQNYSTTCNFSISYNNITYSNVSSGNFTSIQSADNNGWSPNNRSILLSGLQIEPASSFYLRWTSSDVAGSGNRDEIALDDIIITPEGTTVNCTEPTAQPTSLTFGTITSNSIQASFVGNHADQYLVVQSTSPSLGGQPINGIDYTSGATIGLGEVIQKSSSTTFNATGLDENTSYYYFVFSCNTFCNGGPIYRKLDPLTDFIETLESSFTDYYAPIGSETCEELKTALHNLIKDHTVVSYGSLWTHYQTTDDHLNDAGNEVIVWDMYSDNPVGAENEFTFVAEQCGNYQGEGDCYNREHTFPKSWWGGSTSAPQYTDIFAVVPTDGWINGLRSNNPYGEVLSGTETHTTNNGSVMGTSSVSIPGYSGPVFEPIDAYKGDLARGYFYMATRYEDVIATWENNTTESDAVLDGSGYTVYEQWMLDLLISWHESDPVDQKELDRNEAIFGIQGNRNPFIDHPEYVDMIWNGCVIDSCIYVYSGANEGPGSLRSAINCAESGEVITFSPDINNTTIIVSTDSLHIDKNITIEALPEQGIRVAALTPHQASLKTLFKIKSGTQVSLKGFSIDGAYGPHGSAIKNEGILTIENMTITTGGKSDIESTFLNEIGSILVYQGVNTIE